MDLSQFEREVYELLNPKQKEVWQESLGEPFGIELSANEFASPYNEWPNSFIASSHKDFVRSSSSTTENPAAIFAKNAKLVFSLLDKNANREVSLEELSLSTEIRELFAGTGEPNTQNGSEANFIKQYTEFLKNAAFSSN